MLDMKGKTGVWIRFWVKILELIWKVKAGGKKYRLYKILIYFKFISQNN
jgi:hypothetical protein